MKRILVTLIPMMLPLLVQASNRAAAFNCETKVTISNNGVDAVYQTAKREKGLALLLDQMVGAGWNGNLDVIGNYRLPAGARYENTGLDRNRMPFRHESTAKGDETVFILRSRATSATIRIKDNCLNPVQTGNRAVPLMRQDVETTWNFQEVDIQLSIDFHPEVNATATASTAPITITFNNVMAAAPLMNVNANAASQFIMTRDSRGLMSLGYTIGGQTKIYNNVSANGGAGGQGGAGGNVGNITNNNSNANSNVNGNTNVINTGSGSAAGSTAGSGTSNSSAGGKPPG